MQIKSLHAGVRGVLPEIFLKMYMSSDEFSCILALKTCRKNLSFVSILLYKVYPDTRFDDMGVRIKFWTLARNTWLLAAY